MLDQFDIRMQVRDNSQLYKLFRSEIEIFKLTPLLSYKVTV